MSTGLVIGKFLPLHRGHMALIDYARQHCDHLIILLGARPGESIPGPLRLAWLEELYGGIADIDIAYTEDDLPTAPQSDRAVSRVWAAYLQRRFPQAGLIVSSEHYGDYLAEYMGIRHLPYDIPREQLPVSGSVIRQAPLSHWEYLSPPARKYYQKRICIYGPESTGKTTLCRNLARHYDCDWVPEMARSYLGDRMVQAADFGPIAELHARAIQEQVGQGGPFLFVDTDHLTTRIYARHYCDLDLLWEPWIDEANTYDHYLFLDTDVPWVQDNQRHSRDYRPQHRKYFLEALEERGLDYTLIQGSWEQRWMQALRVMDRLLADTLKHDIA